jgi:drug/metabolite transporter (DMT)-like permease
MPEPAFNLIRLTLASAVFLGAIASREGAGAIRSLTRAEWWRIVFLGLVGHALYQRVFLAGVARTSVANSSLIFGCTPVAVALLAAAFRQERLAPSGWAGVLLSVTGIYWIVGGVSSPSSATLAGDALVFTGMLCWSVYSVLGQPLLARRSPLVVTGLSMAAGTVLYVALTFESIVSIRWSAVSGLAWALTTGSALLALVFAYLVWYTAVQRIGSARTALYNNLTPIAAMTIAAVWLGERVRTEQVVGAMLIVGGLLLARRRGDVQERQKAQG